MNKQVEIIEKFKGQDLSVTEFINGHFYQPEDEEFIKNQMLERMK